MAAIAACTEAVWRAVMENLAPPRRTIPATTAATLIAAFGLGTVSEPATASCSPQRRANANTGTSPADDTRFGSSNATYTAETV
jgi:hypothetical protein